VTLFVTADTFCHIDAFCHKTDIICHFAIDKTISCDILQHVATTKMTQEQVDKAILDLPDEVLSGLQFSAPWQYDPSDGDNVGSDPDGYTLASDDKDDSSAARQALQAECWRKFNRTPYINTAVRG